jgi:hypothetical protein
MEVRPGRNLEDQFAVVVAALLDDEKSEDLDTMKMSFAKVIAEIRAWEDEREARLFIEDHETSPDIESFRPATSIPFPTRPNLDLSFLDEMKTAIFKDGKLQLLLKLMGAERQGERGIIIQLLC